MQRSHVSVVILLALTAFLPLAGCQQKLMRTPNLYVCSEEDPFEAVPPALQSNRVDVLYATDRAPEPGKKCRLRYGYQRSRSLGFGTCEVEFGKDVSWDELVRESRTQHRTRSLPLSVQAINEVGRFSETPILAAFRNGVYSEDAEVIAKRAEDERQFKELLSKRLAETPRREVFIYVHGYNNTFDDAAFVMAELWHFMGRVGVPMIYTWPAGSPEGAIGGYTHDSESGQFTGYHFRQFLKLVASCPDVEKIHLIGHSRGTDVVTTAIRELNIEFLAQGRQTRTEMKLGNLVLAAPDLDLEVTSQRITAERVTIAPERMTIYVSSTDRAIAIADLLYGSKRRIGQLRWTDLTPEARKMLEAGSRMQIIDAHVKAGFIGHSYFHESPAVSSDLILLLRDNRPPGAENGRPLTRRQESFWEIDDTYPRGATGDVPE